MHYLTRKIKDLSEQDKHTIMTELLDIIAEPPITQADQIQLVLMADFTNDAKERVENFGKMQGLSSGYPSIDELTKGFVPGELTVLAGKTSYGKTTVAMNIANRVVLAGKRVLFVTMEMTHVELTSRYMYINGGETEDYQYVAANTVFQKNDELNWQSIDGLIRHAKEDMQVDLVIVDHLHYFTRELENVAEDLGRITKELKKNAQRHKVAIILISHVRKTFKDQAATMEDLRGSSYIAQDADIVLMVGRDPQDSSTIHVKVEKNRNRGFDHNNPVAILNFNNTKITERGKIDSQ